MFDGISKVLVLLSICFWIYVYCWFSFRVIGTSDATIDVAIIVLMIILVPSIAVSARRLHDINQSGWMQCIFIPGFMADEFLGTGYVI